MSDDEPGARWLRNQMGQWTLLAACAFLCGWIAIARAIGGAVGLADGAGVAAFWFAVTVVLGLLVRARIRPSGLSPGALLAVSVTSAAGATLLALGRAMRGTDLPAMVGPLGLLLLLGPIGWAAVRIVFGRPAEPD